MYVFDLDGSNKCRYAGIYQIEIISVILSDLKQKMFSLI